MQLGYIIHYVDNVTKTLAFYEAAFGCARRFVTAEGDYGELETGATTLAFASFALVRAGAKNPVRADATAPSSEIAFITDAVAPAYEKALQAGAGPVQAPKVTDWGQNIAYVSDCDGFLVEICTPVGG